jgi:hypothetical protein
MFREQFFDIQGIVHFCETGDVISFEPQAKFPSIPIEDVE